MSTKHWYSYMKNSNYILCKDEFICGIFMWPKGSQPPSHSYPLDPNLRTKVFPKSLYDQVLCFSWTDLNPLTTNNMIFIVCILLHKYN
jgi:hypothetical protein